MMSGAAVTASNVNPMLEFGGDAVVYFDPYSTESITNTITELLCDETKLEKMKKLSLENAKQYSWKYFAKNMNDVCMNAAIEQFIKIRLYAHTRN
jgi:glycosyltransferase involved in cell wall biosynthesis